MACCWKNFSLKIFTLGEGLGPFCILITSLFHISYYKIFYITLPLHLLSFHITLLSIMIGLIIFSMLCTVTICLGLIKIHENWKTPIPFILSSRIISLGLFAFGLFFPPVIGVAVITLALGFVLRNFLPKISPVLFGLKENNKSQMSDNFFKGKHSATGKKYFYSLNAFYLAASIVICLPFFGIFIFSLQSLNYSLLTLGLVVLFFVYFKTIFMKRYSKIVRDYGKDDKKKQESENEIRLIVYNNIFGFLHEETRAVSSDGLRAISPFHRLSTVEQNDQNTSNNDEEDSVNNYIN